MNSLLVFTGTLLIIIFFVYYQRNDDVVVPILSNMKLLVPKNSLVRIEQELGEARVAIRRAIKRRNFTIITSEKDDFIPRGCVYRNAYAFHQLSNNYT